MIAFTLPFSLPFAKIDTIWVFLWPLLEHEVVPGIIRPVQRALSLRPWVVLANLMMLAMQAHKLILAFELVKTSKCMSFQYLWKKKDFFF